VTCPPRTQSPSLRRTQTRRGLACSQGRLWRCLNNNGSACCFVVCPVRVWAAARFCCCTCCSRIRRGCRTSGPSPPAKPSLVSLSFPLSPSPPHSLHHTFPSHAHCPKLTRVLLGCIGTCNCPLRARARACVRAATPALWLALCCPVADTE